MLFTFQLNLILEAGTVRDDSVSDCLLSAGCCAAAAENESVLQENEDGEIREMCEESSSPR